MRLLRTSLIAFAMAATLPAFTGAVADAQTLPEADSKPAKPKTARIVEDVPGPNVEIKRSLVRVSAENTPSGFRVPRYVSLKYSRSRGRTGPSKQHPVAWEYKKRGLPMIVVAETEVWRKVRDVNGDESWMDRRLLDGQRMVLVRTEITLRAKPRSDSKRRAIAAKGALLSLEECDARGWCEVKNEANGTRGYALKSLLWGAERL